MRDLIKKINSLNKSFKPSERFQSLKCREPDNLFNFENRERNVEKYFDPTREEILN